MFPDMNWKHIMKAVFIYLFDNGFNMREIIVFVIHEYMDNHFHAAKEFEVKFKRIYFGNNYVKQEMQNIIAL